MSLLYLDTSALVKLVVREHHSDAVRAGVTAATACTASHLTVVEAHATFARMRAGGRLDGGTYARIASAVDRFWADVAVVPVDGQVVSAGVEIARRHALRGYDAMQLAAALEVARTSVVTFASFDAELEAAATREGLGLLPR
ncbi:type II toxin-antitoxin system VapC family toxin [Patulibacter sp. S7RM1-6]